MNDLTSPTELTDLFSTAELIFGAGALALFLGIGLILTGPSNGARAGIALGTIGVVTVAVAMVWSFVDNFDDIINVFTGDSDTEIPFLGIVSATVIGVPLIAVGLAILVLGITLAVSAVGRRIRGNQPPTMNGEPA